MADFVTMGRQEAKRFLAAFLAQTPDRLARLREESARSGGPAADALDLTHASLGPLWSWASPRFAWREGQEPPPSGLPSPRVADDRSGDEDLPEWFDHKLLNWARFTSDSLWLIDGLARYLGECLLRQVPDAQWVAGHSRRKGYVYQNHPVIEGLPVGHPVQPMWSVSFLAEEVLDPSRQAGSLLDLHAVWTNPPGGNRP